jgi:hypothetical protein
MTSLCSRTWDLYSRVSALFGSQHSLKVAKSSLSLIDDDIEVGKKGPVIEGDDTISFLILGFLRCWLFRSVKSYDCSETDDC